MSRIIPVKDNGSDDKVIIEAVEAMKDGKIIVFPTETLYGLGTDCENEEAVDKLFQVKKRDSSKALPILAADIGMVLKYADAPPAYGIELMEKLWPGAVTMVFNAQPTVISRLTGNSGTIGIRVPGSDFCRKMIQRMGRGITATSANFSGEPESRTIWEIPDAVKDKSEIILHAGEYAESAKPSTVIAVYEDQPRLLRKGAVPVEKIEDACKMTIEPVTA